MELLFNNFLTDFTKNNTYIIKNVKYNILISRGQEPFIVTEFLEKINNIIYNQCVLLDDNLKQFVYNIFDKDYCKVYDNYLNDIIKKISFEFMYFLTHDDFNTDTCEIINNNKYLNDTLIKLQLFFYLNKK